LHTLTDEVSEAISFAVAIDPVRPWARRDLGNRLKTTVAPLTGSIGTVGGSEIRGSTGADAGLSVTDPTVGAKIVLLSSRDGSGSGNGGLKNAGGSEKRPVRDEDREVSEVLSEGYVNRVAVILAGGKVGPRKGDCYSSVEITLDGG
jgi:hypothetical protein